MDEIELRKLADLLAKLTRRQRLAIDRIVEHVDFHGGELADLLQGPHRICAPSTYYRIGGYNPETGERTGYGWGHDPDFQAALQQARKVAFS